MKKLIVFLILMLLVVCLPPSTSFGKNKVVGCYSKEFQKKAELKKAEIKHRRYKRGKGIVSVKPNQPLEVMVTGAVIGKQLHTSALGYKIKPGECAVSQDMIDMLGKNIKIGKPVGKYAKQKLASVGKLKVACVMPNKWKRRVDVYVKSRTQAYAITGKRTVVTM